MIDLYANLCFSDPPFTLSFFISVMFVFVSVSELTIAVVVAIEAFVVAVVVDSSVSFLEVGVV